MHLGVIPDGNRRYAREQGIEEREAYLEAKEVLADIFDKIKDLPVEIEEVTLYLLSEDNLERDDEELETLFDLLAEEIEDTASRWNSNGFQFNWVSTRPEALPGHLREKLRDLENKYRKGERNVNTLISYSGKRDVVQAAQKVCGNGGDFSQEALRKHLDISSEIDFVIRTGDNPTRESISDFPIWNSSYAEYYHIQKHFPEVTVEDVEEALEHYKELRRKKGK